MRIRAAPASAALSLAVAAGALLPGAARAEAFCDALEAVLAQPIGYAAYRGDSVAPKEWASAFALPGATARGCTVFGSEVFDTFQCELRTGAWEDVSGQAEVSALVDRIQACLAGATHAEFFGRGVVKAPAAGGQYTIKIVVEAVLKRKSLRVSIFRPEQ